MKTSIKIKNGLSDIAAIVAREFRIISTSYAILLGLIGANMIRESRGGEEHVDSSFRPRSMLPLAVATSIDALAVGVTFAFLRVEIGPAVSCIVVITFLLSAAGVYIGGAFGDRFQGKAELAGGVILVLMGSKILLEHLGFLG